jgi:hypothetical protein
MAIPMVSKRIIPTTQRRFFAHQIRPDPAICAGCFKKGAGGKNHPRCEVNQSPHEKNLIL